MRAAMRAASPYLFAMWSPVRIVSDFTEHGAIGEIRRSRGLRRWNAYVGFAGGFVIFAGGVLVAVVGSDTSCQSLMPPSMALLFAPRMTWLGRSFISLALPPPRRTESQTSPALRRSTMSRTDFLQRSSPRRWRPARPTYSS